MYFLDLDCSLQEWWSADASSCAGTRTRSGEFELVDAMLEQLTVSFPLQYIRTHLHRLCGACSISRPSPGHSRTQPAAPTRRPDPLPQPLSRSCARPTEGSTFDTLHRTLEPDLRKTPSSVAAAGFLQEGWTPMGRRLCGYGFVPRCSVLNAACRRCVMLSLACSLAFLPRFSFRRAVGDVCSVSFAVMIIWLLRSRRLTLRQRHSQWSCSVRRVPILLILIRAHLPVR